MNRVRINTSYGQDGPSLISPRGRHTGEESRVLDFFFFFLILSFSSEFECSKGLNQRWMS